MAGTDTASPLAPPNAAENAVAGPSSATSPSRRPQHLPSPSMNGMRKPSFHARGDDAATSPASPSYVGGGYQPYQQPDGPSSGYYQNPYASMSNPYASSPQHPYAHLHQHPSQAAAAEAYYRQHLYQQQQQPQQQPSRIMNPYANPYAPAAAAGNYGAYPSHGAHQQGPSAGSPYYPYSPLSNGGAAAASSSSSSSVNGHIVAGPSRYASSSPLPSSTVTTAAAAAQDDPMSFNAGGAASAAGGPSGSPSPSPRFAPQHPGAYTAGGPSQQPPSHFNSFVPGRYGHPAYYPHGAGAASGNAPPFAQGAPRSYRGNNGSGNYPVIATAPAYRPQHQPYAHASPSYYAPPAGQNVPGGMYPVYLQQMPNGQAAGLEFDDSAAHDVDAEQPVFASISNSDPDASAQPFSPPTIPLHPGQISHPPAPLAFGAGDDDRPPPGAPQYHVTIAHTPQTTSGMQSPPALPHPYSPPAGLTSPHQQFSVPPSIGAVLSPPLPSNATFGANGGGAAPGSVSPSPSNAAIYASVMKAKTPVLEQRPELGDDRVEGVQVQESSAPEGIQAPAPIVAPTIIDPDAPSGWSISESPSATSFWLANRAPSAPEAPAISIARTARPPRKTRKNAQKHHEPRQAEAPKPEVRAREQQERVAFASQLLRSRCGESDASRLTFGEIEAEEYQRLMAKPAEEPPATPKPEKDAAAVATDNQASATTAPTTPAVPRAPPKSWAALLRNGQPASALRGSPAPSIASAQIASNVATPGSSPIAAPSGLNDAVSQAPSEIGTPVQATSPVALKARPPAAWTVPGKFSNEEMSRLLLEGLPAANMTARARTATVPRGLINTGNMCFANSIMQVLAYCGPFTALFEELGKRVQADLGRRTPLIEAMVLFLKEFAPVGADVPGEGKGELLPSPFPVVAAQAHVRNGSASVLGVKQEPFVPSYVYDAMRENKRFDSMRRGYQEDAEEFLGFFLETLHEEMLYLYSRHESRTFGRTVSSNQLPAHPASTATNEDEREVSRPVSPSAGGDGWLEVGKKQKVNIVRTTENKESSVSRIFGGKLRSVLHTPGQKDSVTLEPYQPLQLEISPNEVVSLEDALRYLNAPEIIPEVWSQSKNMHVDATKQVFIDTLPPILILHLKRFVYDVVEHRVVKRAKPVAYGQELEIPAEIISPARRSQVSTKYKLFGVVYHHGSSATGGHYTACVQRHDPSAPSSADSPATGSWLHLDDETVEEVSVDQVVVGRDAAIKGNAGEVGRAGREKCAYLAFYQRA